MVGISFQSKILIMLLIVAQKSQTGQSGVFKKLFGKFSILLFNVDSFKLKINRSFNYFIGNTRLKSIFFLNYLIPIKGLTLCNYSL